MSSMKSSLLAVLPGSCCAVLYGAHAASGLQSASMSLMRKEEVTVRGGAPGSPSSGRRGEGGEEHALLSRSGSRSASEPGLNSSGEEEQHPPPPPPPPAPSASPSSSAGGPRDNRESIPKAEPEAPGASITSRPRIRGSSEENWRSLGGCEGGSEGRGAIKFE